MSNRSSTPPCARASRAARLLPLLLLLAGALGGCAAPPTYADVQATAQASGCWPDGYPTPRAATATPVGAPAAPPAGTVSPETPRAVAPPTAPPLPRCTPRPGATAAPWPTPVPPPPPFPTMEPRAWSIGSGLQTTLRLPSTLLGIDLAVHPTEGWPVVAAVVWSGTDDPERVLVSVFHPRSRAWDPARQLDTGDARLGRYARSAQVAVTGDGAIVAAWGMSDPDFRDGDPPAALWASASRDQGETWDAPERIASRCRRVNDIAASADGWVAALLTCTSGDSAHPAVAVRTPEGAWRAPVALAVPAWSYSDGTLAVTGLGGDARAHGLVLAGDGRPAAYLITGRLADAGSWQVTARAVDAAVGRPLTTRMWYPRALAYDRARPDGPAAPALTFTWSEADAGGAYALTSLDGGATWGGIEVVAQGAPGERLAFVAPAYDPASDRLAAIWTCCAFEQWETAGTTHYGSWSAPGSGAWLPAGERTRAGRVPLVLGGRSVFETVTAQAAGSRLTWVAWVERQQEVRVRTLDLNQIVPPEVLP